MQFKSKIYLNIYSLNPSPHTMSPSSSPTCLPILFPHPLSSSLVHPSSSPVCLPVLFPCSPLHLENKIVFLNNMMIFNQFDQIHQIS